MKLIRNNTFAEKYVFDNFTQAEEYLEKKLLQMNKNSDIDEEIPCLMPLKPTFELAKLSSQKVNSYGFVKVDNNSYSVPDYLVGKTVLVRNYAREIKFYINEQLICTHKKKDGTNEVSIDINHYLTSLAKKPGAIRNSTALKSIPLLKSIFDNHFIKEPKKFIEILKENQDKGTDNLLDVFNQYLNLSSNVIPMDIVREQSGAHIKTKGIISAYDKLCVGGRR